MRIKHEGRKRSEVKTYEGIKVGREKDECVKEKEEREVTKNEWQRRWKRGNRELRKKEKREN